MTSPNPPVPAPATIGDWTEADLANYLAGVFKAQERSIGKRFWTATVTNTNLVANPIQVQVVMDGEQNSSGAWFKVAGGTYIPRIGDIVVGFWYAEQQGWVLFPKVEQGYTSSRMYRASALTVGAGETLCGMDTVHWDNLGVCDTVTNKGFVIKAPGKYRVSGRVNLNTASSVRLYAAIYSNGTEVRRGDDITSSEPAATVDDLMALNAGDVVQLYQQAGSSQPTTVGLQHIYFSIQWIP